MGHEVNEGRGERAGEKAVNSWDVHSRVRARETRDQGLYRSPIPGLWPPINTRQRGT